MHKIWRDAFAALPDDMKPLARLIRCDTPFPADARILLAELLAPGNPPVLEWQLECKANKQAKKARRNAGIEDNYRKNLAGGLKPTDAAEQAGKSESRTFAIVRKKPAKRLRNRELRLQLAMAIGKMGGRLPGDE
jgi:hypothetical protein